MLQITSMLTGLASGLALAAAAAAWFSHNRAERLMDDILAEELAHLATVAQLNACQARLTLSQEGDNLDDQIPNDLRGFVPPDGFLHFAE